MDTLYNAIQEAKKQTDPALAISIIEAYSARELDHKRKAEAFFYTSALRQEAGDYQGAIKDLHATLKLCTPGSYTHYASEMSLGYVHTKLGLIEDATSWYRKALKTSADYKGLVGGTALKSFLDITGVKNLTAEDRALCERVVKASWDVLQMEGKPDISDLVKMADMIIHRQSNPD